MTSKQNITHNLLNIPGRYTNRKIVVIESDDRKIVRTHSREVYEEYLRRRVRVNIYPYGRYDCPISTNDLSTLFDVQVSVKENIDSKNSNR